MQSVFLVYLYHVFYESDGFNTRVITNLKFNICLYVHYGILFLFVKYTKCGALNLKFGSTNLFDVILCFCFFMNLDVREMSWNLGKSQNTCNHIIILNT